jgi:hypothetical protein
MEVSTMKQVRAFYFVLAIFALFIMQSCGGGGGGGGGTATTSQPGSLSLSLTDASTDAYQAVYVTIGEVQVHMNGGAWKVVASPNKTYNLLDLVNGVREQLGISELDAGNYTEMRLIIGETPDGGINILTQKHPYANYVIDLDDNEHELKVPSGYQTGVKIVQGFTISEKQTTELVLDFSASASVVVAGKSGNWLLKPTIKVLNTEEWAIISGTVRDGANQGVEGVLVSAQIFTEPPANPSADDIENEVVIETSTVTDAAGQYKIFIRPGTYNIVAYSTYYSPAVECSVKLVSGEVAPNNDFPLVSVETETVSGSVTISGAVEDQYATISFRQLVDCNADGIPETPIEVSSVNVINGGTYSMTLPVGSYEVIASSYQVPTVVEPLDILSGVTSTVLDISM